MQFSTKCAQNIYTILTKNKKYRIMKRVIEMKSNLHNVLKSLRNEKHETQIQVAKALNVSQQVYSNYEKGDRQPSIETLIDMAEYFNVPLDILVGRYEKRKED